MNPQTYQQLPLDFGRSAIEMDRIPGASPAESVECCQLDDLFKGKGTARLWMEDDVNRLASLMSRLARWKGRKLTLSAQKTVIKALLRRTRPSGAGYRPAHAGRAEVPQPQLYFPLEFKF